MTTAHRLESADLGCRPTRWATAAGLTLLVLSAVTLASPPTVLAHAGLVSSTPAASTVIEQSPPLISFADGHVVTGAFSFQVGTSSTADGDALIGDVIGGARAEPVVGRALGVARFAAFIGLAMLLGGLFLVMTTTATADVGWPARRVLWIGWLLLVVGTAANFGLLGANAAAGGLGDAFDQSLWTDIAGTRTGGLLLARLGLLAMIGAAVVELERRGRLWWKVGATLIGVVLVLTFSGGGHPSVQVLPALWIGVDAIHLLLVALWMGGLVMMTLGGREWLREDSRAIAVRRFSRMAAFAVPLIVVTGVAQAWRLSGGFESLTDTTWGRILLAKGTLVVLVATIGAGSRWLLANDGPSALRRTVVTETLIGVAVLGLAAGMVGVPPEASERSRVFAVSLAEAGVIVDVSVTPGRVGSNQVHIVVVPPGGSLVPVANVTARVSLSANNVPNTPVTLIAESANHYSGNVTLAFTGDWTLEIVVSPEVTQSILLATTVPIP